MIPWTNGRPTQKGDYILSFERTWPQVCRGFSQDMTDAPGNTVTKYSRLDDVPWRPYPDELPDGYNPPLIILRHKDRQGTFFYETEVYDVTKDYPLVVGWSPVL